MLMARSLVSRVDWEAQGPNTTRLLVHLGDTPCHGTKCHAVNLNDNHPDGDPLVLDSSMYVQPPTTSYRGAELDRSRAYDPTIPPP
jgi:hypothetical protein